MAVKIRNGIVHHNHFAILYADWHDDTWHYPVLQSLVSLNGSFSCAES
jgi:hypothetical protein